MSEPDPHSEPLTEEQERAIKVVFRKLDGDLWARPRQDAALSLLRSLVRDVVGQVEKERDRKVEDARHLSEGLREYMKRLDASEASAEELRRKDEAQRELIASLTGKLYAAEASAQELRETMNKIATYNCEGDGPGTICGDCAQSLARAALDETQKNEAMSKSKQELTDRDIDMLVAALGMVGGNLVNIVALCTEVRVLRARVKKLDEEILNLRAGFSPLDL